MAGFRGLFQYKCDTIYIAVVTTLFVSLML